MGSATYQVFVLFSKATLSTAFPYKLQKLGETHYHPDSNIADRIADVRSTPQRSEISVEGSEQSISHITRDFTDAVLNRHPHRIKLKINLSQEPSGLD